MAQENPLHLEGLVRPRSPESLVDPDLLLDRLNPGVLAAPDTRWSLVTPFGQFDPTQGPKVEVWSRAKAAKAQRQLVL